MKRTITINQMLSMRSALNGIMPDGSNRKFKGLIKYIGDPSLIFDISDIMELFDSKAKKVLKSFDSINSKYGLKMVQVQKMTEKENGDNLTDQITLTKDEYNSIEDKKGYVVLRNYNQITDVDKHKIEIDQIMNKEIEIDIPKLYIEDFPKIETNGNNEIYTYSQLLMTIKPILSRRKE
jgi:hypothetical protein